jgi:CheY-like chemotaxis protein
MISVAKGLTKHTAVIVVDKRERGIAMQALLQKMGLKVIVSLSLYDALKFIAQEMPHIVITDALLSDGSACAMFDRLAQHPQLKKTPILVNIQKKSREEITALGQRKFAGFFLGKVEPQPFMAKILTVLSGFSEVSPYFVSPESCKIGAEIAISLTANIVGRKGEFVVSRSNMELDETASLICAPKDRALGPILVRMPSNLEDQEGIMNLFPISRIMGKGRIWVDALPDIALNNDELKRNLVYFYDPEIERFNQFKETLLGYDIELTHAPTLARLASMVQRDAEHMSCVYIHELSSDASSIEWKKVYSQIPVQKRPPLIIGTTSQNAKSIPGMRFIKRPFGLGVFVETLEASFEKAGTINRDVSATGYTGVQVRYQAPAKLMGLDETGGIIELKFSVKPGSRIELDHPFLNSLWDGQKVVAATASGPVPGRANTWQLRFESVAAGTSKAKYWDRMSKALEARVEVPAALIAS